LRCARWGHGDEIAIVDGNYPAQDHARRLVRADGHGLIPLLEAILQVTASGPVGSACDPARGGW
jgi:L-fucose mutarotase/ribose pyranase (RbsD/FucU family)